MDEQLVHLLRHDFGLHRLIGQDDRDLVAAAADEIERLHAKIQRLEAAGDAMYHTVMTCPDPNIIPVDMERDNWTRKLRRTLLAWAETRHGN